MEFVAHGEREEWEWDGTLAPSPGSADRFAVPPGPQQAWIGYLKPSEGSIDTRVVTLYEKPEVTDKPIDLIPPYTRNDLMSGTFKSVGPRGETRSDRRILVFSRRPGWFEVGMDEFSQHGRTGTVWLPEAGWDFQAVDNPDDVEQFLAAWTGVGKSTPAVEVKEARRVNGVLWFRVRVFMGGICDHVFEHVRDAELFAASVCAPGHHPG